ncbi:hypothetical protein ACOVUO_000186 [Escherichia coli]|nr:hypothetical protein [Escherichia coli]MED9215614.1 hypothetical protein [Escherichia coli]
MSEKKITASILGKTNFYLFSIDDYYLFAGKLKRSGNQLIY